MSFVYAWAVMAFTLFASVPVRAADLVSGLSTDLIQITSSFTGTDFVLFGAIDPPQPAVPNAGARMQDLVIVIRGPTLDMTVRRKERVLGLWINREQVEFGGLPGYYFLASTRPLDSIASAQTLARFRLGTANLGASARTPISVAEANEFRAAVVRDRTRENLYRESATGIEFLSPTLFRARVPVPASVPPGEYRAEVYLFQNGTVVSAQSSPLSIDKSGFERQVYNFAYQQSWAYGLAAVIMAFSMGWIGYLLFRPR
jgi:uncharacterized protein (TIGR02186 family)